jgi:hypothetical protein
MAFARWQATIVDDLGNVIPGASITVLSEAVGNPLAVLKSDRLGAVALGNPFNADGSGFASFHVVGGSYRITATKGSFSKEFRYVGVGLSSETDGTQPGIGFLFDNSIVDADPGDGKFRFNNATLASVTTLFVDDKSSPSLTTISAWLNTFDDGGGTLNRGTIQIINTVGDSLFIATVTGTIVNGTGYRKISVTPVVTVGTFAVGEIAYMTFTQKGVDGGDVVGPASAVNGNLATFNTTTGKLIQDSGKSLTTVGAGKQSIIIPAVSLTKTAAAAGPSLGQLAIGAFTGDYLAFDPTTLEDAHISLAMPKSWDKGNITARFCWSHPATTTNFAVAWTIYGKAYGDNEAIDGASYGGGNLAIDTGGTTNNLYLSAETAAFSPAGTPADNDMMHFIIRRLASDAGDTLAVDAFLHTVEVFYTTNANTDA